MRKAQLFPLAMAAVIVASCATGPGGSGERSDRRTLTASEISETDLQTAFEVVEALRPSWLRDRGAVSLSDPSPSVASVYLDGSLAGDIHYLRNVRAGDVSEMRFLPPGQAAVRFGMGHPRGVIEVVQKDRAH